MGVKITNLTKKFDSFGKEIVALGGLNIEFCDGELVAIIGASGSGKTTLLNQMCGMDIPDSREVVIDGVNISKLSSNGLCKLRRTKIGVIYQFYNLLQELNVRDNITLPVELDGGAVDEDELCEIRIFFTEVVGGGVAPPALRDDCREGVFAFGEVACDIVGRI